MLDYLVDLSILLDVSAGVLHQRLVEREAPDFLAGWHCRWDEAWHISHVRPASAFDVVVTNE